MKGGVVLSVLHGAGATHEGPTVVSTLLAVEVNLNMLFWVSVVERGLLF